MDSTSGGSGNTTWYVKLPDENEVIIQESFEHLLNYQKKFGRVATNQKFKSVLQEISSDKSAELAKIINQELSLDSQPAASSSSTNGEIKYLRIVPGISENNPEPDRLIKNDSGKDKTSLGKLLMIALSVVNISAECADLLELL